MSEYQYYYFEAIDAPLTELQQKELRKVSTRAQINSRRFENEYNWGDLGADPKTLLQKYFDIHLYYANWGTRIIMFRIPANAIDFGLAKQYDNNDTVRVTKKGNYVIVEFTGDSEDEDEWWEESMKINKYVTFRDDLMAGDYRCLYIAWLAEEEYGDENKKQKTPPIPPGMKKLTGTLRAFVDFMYLDKAKLKSALESASEDEPPEPTLKEIKEWVAKLPDKDCQKVLVDLLHEKSAPQVVQREFRNRFLKDRKTETSKTPTPSKTPCQKKPAKKTVKKTVKKTAPVKKQSKKS